MATALSIALKSCIEDNWSAVTGGTEPTVYGSDSTVWPKKNEWIRILGWTFGMGGFKRLNDKYIGYWEEITFEVSTKNHADKESRLDEMVTELRRIITPTNLTGYHLVDVTARTRRPSDQTKNVWAEQMTVRATVKSTLSAVTPGSTTTSALTVDTLTVNTLATIASVLMSGDIDMGDDNGISVDFSANGTFLGIAAENNDVTLWKVNANAADHTVTSSGFFLKYVGTGAGDANYLELWRDNGAGAATFVYRVHQTTNQTDFADDVLINSTQSLSDALMLGSTKAAWVPCSFDLESSVGAVYLKDRAITNVDGTDHNQRWGLLQPTTKGSLKLYITGTKVLIEDADAAAYVDAVLLEGVVNASATIINNHSTNGTSQGDHTDTFAAIDCSSYDQIIVRVGTVVDAINELDIHGVLCQCYYA